MAKLTVERDPPGVPTDENFFNTLYAPAVNSGTKAVEVFSPAADSDAVTVDVTTPPSLATLTAEIRLHLNQIGYHFIAVGERLLLAKELVGYGNWSAWLKANFKLSQDTATNFINVAKRFGANSETYRNFSFSQLVTMLKLPKGTEEKFIADKVIEGKNIEGMTVKELREEVKHWKVENLKTQLKSMHNPDTNARNDCLELLNNFF